VEYADRKCSYPLEIAMVLSTLKISTWWLMTIYCRYLFFIRPLKTQYIADILKNVQGSKNSKIWVLRLKATNVKYNIYTILLQLETRTASKTKEKYSKISRTHQNNYVLKSEKAH